MGKEKKVLERVLFWLGVLCALGVIVFGALEILGKLEGALVYSEMMLGALMLVQGLQNLKRSVAVAVFSFCAAAFVFAVSAYILLA